MGRVRATMLSILTASASAFQNDAQHLFRPMVISTTRLYSKNGNTEPNHQFLWRSRQKCWRPDISDVERISFGKPAKKKGTGSRGVPHRLNEDERFLFDQARKKGFLEVIGSGWRPQRREAPLLNTYRNLCDARGRAGIVLHKGSTGMDDKVLVDLSPLRLPEIFQAVTEECVQTVQIQPFAGTSSEDVGELEAWDVERTEENDDPWETRPIYQLSPFLISWVLPRSEAKALSKKLADMFQTVEVKASKSKKPKGIKPGKNRRSGGYGIG